MRVATSVHAIESVRFVPKIESPLLVFKIPFLALTIN